MEESRTPEAVAKSLRWLSNMFPIVIGSDDREDRMSTCIHMYTASGADTISTIQAENEKLRAERVELEQMASCIYYKQGGLCRYGEEDPANVCVFGPCDHEKSAQEAQAELEQVKRELDEAVQCFRGIAKSGRVWMCPYCVHAKDTTGGIAECELDVGVCMMPYSKFEWRGQKED